MTILLTKTMYLIHWFSIFAWLCGVFYLPRIFVYQMSVAAGSESDQLFCKMGDRLWRFIMTPAVCGVIASGSTLAYVTHAYTEGWFHVKALCVLLLLGLHVFMFTINRRLKRGVRQFSASFFRVLNEAPTVIVLIILVMVIFQPF